MLAIDMVALIDEFCRIGCAVRCQDGAHEGVDVAFFVAHRAKGSALAQLQSEKTSFASHCRSGYLVWTYQLLKSKVAAFRDLYKMSHSFSHGWGMVRFVCCWLWVAAGCGRIGRRNECIPALSCPACGT